MAVTFAFTKVAVSKWGNRQRWVWDVSATGTYTTGGDSFIPPLPQRKIEEIHIQGLPSDGTVAYPATYLPTTKLLKFWETGAAVNAGLAEKGSAESVSTTTFRITAIGY